ncbi:MAG: glycosyltransferase [Bifidobacteriaceae bacterium]|jgi:D-inositol-3-phosphate glycosyltransferase|nr:glycosyltransferase [Bifidobacteriaceae bacterium]
MTVREAAPYPGHCYFTGLEAELRPAAPARGPARVALVSLHTSPLAVPGQGDAGGMNVYLLGVAKAMARQGVAVDLYTRAASADELARPTVSVADGVAVHFLRAGPVAPLAKEDLPGVADQFAAGLARHEPAAVVHSHYWLSGLAGAQVAAAWGVPHVQSLHTVASLKNATLAPGDQAEPALRLAEEQRLAQGAARVVAVSPAERDAIVRDYGVPAERVAVVSPGVDPAVFHPAAGQGLPKDLPAALNRPQGYILMLGRVQPIKGQDLAIRALAHLKPATRPALVVLGAPSSGHLDYAVGLKRLAADLGVAGDVVFLGAQPVDRLVALIQGGRLTVMPSRSETFGMVALESAACGTPVVAANTTGLRSAVADGVSGLLVDGRDPAVWAGAIGRVLRDGRLRARLSRGGVELGRSRSWDVAAGALLAAYRPLVCCCN